MLSHQAVAIFFVFVASAGAHDYRMSYVECFTRTAKTPVKSVPTTTTTYARTFPLTKTTVYTPSVVVTPKAATTKSTRFTTITLTITKTRKTDTSTSTATAQVTATITALTSTITTISTNYSTSTSIVASTTVPTPSGFLPVQSTLPGALAKRDLEESLNGDTLDQKQETSPKTLWKPSNGTFYPAAVRCIDFELDYTIVTKTHTAHKTKTTTLKRKTSTITTTSTRTTVSTIVPIDASITVTSTSTSTMLTTFTPVTTSTSTTTSIYTSILPGPTYYAACSSDNFAGAGLLNSADGNGSALGSIGAIYTPFTLGNYDYEFSNASTPYDCCVSCIEDPTCLLEIYQLQGGPGSYCYKFTNPNNATTCPANLGAATSIVYPDDLIIISNSFCVAYTYSAQPDRVCC